MKNRNKQRENRKKKKTEGYIIKKTNIYGVRDLTAYNAIKRCESKHQVEILLN